MKLFKNVFYLTALFSCCTLNAQDFTESRIIGGVKQKDKNAIVVQSDLKLFPNPNTGNQLYLKYQFAGYGQIQVSIYNISGSKVLQKRLPVFITKVQTTSLLPLPNLKPGMYLLRLTNGKESETAKFIVSK